MNEIIATFNADKNTMTLDETVVLSWESENVNTIYINNGVGYVEPVSKGEFEFFPEVLGEIIITATFTNSNEAIDKSISVIVIRSEEESLEEPTVNFNISPTRVFSGGSVLMSWETTNADHIEISGIDDDIASIKNGNLIHPIFFSGMQIFTITATGPGGYAQASIEVNGIDVPIPIEPEDLEDTEDPDEPDEQIPIPDAPPIRVIRITGERIKF